MSLASEHPGRRIDANTFARHLRDDERDAPPVLRGPAGVGCPALQDQVTFALCAGPLNSPDNSYADV